MSSRLKVYLAGPDVFLPDAVSRGRQKKELCAHCGFEGLFSFDNEISGDRFGTRVDLLIYRANVAMIHEADLGIFNLTPFRGSSAESAPYSNSVCSRRWRNRYSDTQAMLMIF